MFFFFLQFNTAIAFSQTRHIDSLRKIFYTTTDNKKKLSALFSLCDQANSVSLDSLYIYYTQASSLARQQHDKENILLSNFYKATYLSKKGMLDSAENIIDSCVAQLNSKEETPLKFRFLILKSNVLIRSDKQKESMDNSLQLLHEAEKVNDYSTQVRAKNNIGWAYMELGQNREALNWFFEAAKLDKNLTENNRQPFIYSNIAAVYNNLGKNDSALFFGRQAINLAMKKNDLTYLANAYFIYAGIYNDLGNRVKTDSLLQEGLRIRKLIGDPFFIVSDIFQIGLFYANYHEPAKGIAILKEGIATAQKNNLYEKLPILYTALARNYKVAGDLVQYSKTLDTLLVLKDSLYKKNSAEALAEMQAKYDLQKKENTIIQQQYDLTKKNYFIYSVVALFTATLLFGFFVSQNRKKNQKLKIQALQTEQKRKTTQAVMQAEEDERKRIAADLHDSVAQKMVVAKLNLEALGNNLQNINEPMQKIYDNINALLEESASEVRKLSHSMMPQAFARYGLINAVTELLNKISKAGLKINFKTEGDFSVLKENAALMIYRIIQECLQNILKHAHATCVNISMITSQNDANIIIEDNGVGFNMNAADEESTGLKNIRSRIEYLNGKLDINSKPGKGTVVACYIPLHET